jgi:hypothetical protein
MDINVNQLYLAVWAVCAVGLGVHGQPLRQLPTQPACIERCLTAHEGCFECVKILSQERFSAPRKMLLPFHKVSMHRISFGALAPPCTNTHSLTHPPHSTSRHTHHCQTQRPDCGITTFWIDRRGSLAARMSRTLQATARSVQYCTVHRIIHTVHSGAHNSCA